MAPVRRTLVAIWMAEGSSELAKMEGVESGSSKGPSSTASASWVSHGEEEEEEDGGMGERGCRIVGL